ncbi:hypothetical protein Tco_1303813 [Tanacetum coccineum]
MMDRKDLFETKAKGRSDGKAKEKILVLIPETTFVGVESRVLIPETTFVGVESRVLIPETTFVGVESRVLIPEMTVWDTLVYPSDTLVIPMASYDDDFATVVNPEANRSYAYTLWQMSKFEAMADLSFLFDCFNISDGGRFLGRAGDRLVSQPWLTKKEGVDDQTQKISRFVLVLYGIQRLAVANRSRIGTLDERHPPFIVGTGIEHTEAINKGLNRRGRDTTDLQMRKFSTRTPSIEKVECGKSQNIHKELSKGKSVVANQKSDIPQSCHLNLVKYFDSGPCRLMNYKKVYGT